MTCVAQQKSNFFRKKLFKSWNVLLITTIKSQVQPITVASKEYAAGTQALMTGWGKTYGGKKYHRQQFVCSDVTKTLKVISLLSVIWCIVCDQSHVISYYYTNFIFWLISSKTFCQNASSLIFVKHEHRTLAWTKC